MSGDPINNFSSNENYYSTHDFSNESLNKNNNNNPNNMLTVIFNTVAQVMQKINAKVRQSNNIQQLNKQIIVIQMVIKLLMIDPLQNLSNLLLYQLFQIYTP